MYHIAVVTSNQEETPVLTRLRETFALKRSPVTYSFLHSAAELEAFLSNEKPDYLFLSTEYDAETQLEFITSLAKKMKNTKRIIPLVYLIEWSQPLSTVLGTKWSSQVGILHNFTSAAEIIDQFQRLDGWGVTVGR